jgi:D-glycero-beta-D-manno-heptose-7-phosphate kinase
MKSLSIEQISQARVLVVGDAMLDRYWYGAVDRISPEAPVPVVLVNRTEERIGAAANVAYNIVTLGAQASLLTVVGADDDGRQLEDLVRASGIAPCFERDPALKTTVKLRVIGRQQQLLRLDFEARPGESALEGLLQSFSTLCPEHQAVLFSDYGKGSLTAVGPMIRQAKAEGKAVLVDPKGADYARYAEADLITPNRAELEQVIGTWHTEAELASKAQALRQSLNLGALLLTRSEAGMTLFDDKGQLHVSAVAREVFDVTGAGDTVIATLATLIAAGMSLRDAVPLANRAAGCVVGKFGTATVSFAELFDQPKTS